MRRRRASRGRRLQGRRMPFNVFFNDASVIRDDKGFILKNF